MVPRFILMDIEGTTTDIRFVHQVLFPYSRDRLADYITANRQDPAVRECLQQVVTTLREEAPSGLNNETSDDLQAPGDAVLIEALQRWIREDRKHTALKTLQGMIWRAGYECGDYQGHVYPDVPVAFQRWREQGIALGIYSSGSEEAQRLLFRYSTHGDLTPWLSHYFDTRVGAKRENTSYRRIAEAIGQPPADILFLSDVDAELDAAAEAGMGTVLLLRDAAQPGLETPHATAACFSFVGACR